MIGFLILCISGSLMGIDISAVFFHLNSLGIDFAAGIMLFLTMLFLYKGLSSGTMSVVAPIAGAFPAVTIGLSIMLLGQTLSAIEGFGVLAVLIGIILIGFRVSHNSLADLTHIQLLTKGIDSAIISCLLAGSYLFCLAVVVPSLGWWLAAIMLKGAAALTGLGLVRLLRKQFRYPTKSSLLRLVAMALMDAIGFLAYNSGIITAGGYVPIVATFSGMFGVVTLFLAQLFHHESLSRIQWFGTLVLLTGVLTLLYFGT